MPVWLIPLVAVFVVVWADWACHVGHISAQALGCLQTVAGATWALYYTVMAMRAPRYGLALTLFALTMVGIGVLVTALAWRRTVRLGLGPTRDRPESRRSDAATSITIAGGASGRPALRSDRTRSPG